MFCVAIQVLDTLHWVTLNCEGMKATPAWETEVSSLAKETSKRRLSCGSERGTSC
jgi:hypothetical protein